MVGSSHTLPGGKEEGNVENRWPKAEPFINLVEGDTILKILHKCLLTVFVFSRDWDILTDKRKDKFAP